MAHNAQAVCATGTLSAALIIVLPSRIPQTQRVSLILAYSSLAVLLATLAIGPLRVLRGAPNPVSNDRRRDLGILAAITGVGHVAFAFQHHLGGKIILYFFTSGRPSLSGLRRDSFGVGNTVGLVATVVLLLLVAISNDRSLRRLGRSWKRLQRLSYPLAALTVVHMAVFWTITRPTSPIVLGAGVAICGVTALQLTGASCRLRRERTSLPRPNAHRSD